MKSSTERMAALLAEHPQAAQNLVDKIRYCEHEFIVVSKKKSDTAEHATQVMCNKCLNVLSFKGITQLNEDVTNLMNSLPESGEFQTSDDS